MKDIFNESMCMSTKKIVQIPLGTRLLYKSGDNDASGGMYVAGAGAYMTTSHWHIRKWCHCRSVQ